MKNGEKRAFPADEHTHTDGGLTKREYFAGLAMQGMARIEGNVEDIAHDAVKIADALLAELRKQEYKTK
jgi:hypothetical protein